MLDQAGPLDVVIVPCGGGGLLSGTAVAVKGRAPGTKVIGAEPAAADDARRSLESGSIVPSNDPKTVADGLRTSLGERTFAVIRDKVDAIVTATEREILDATRFLWERVKILTEPSSAVAVAPLFNGQVDVSGQRVGVILSGGNVDTSPLFDALAAKVPLNGPRPPGSIRSAVCGRACGRACGTRRIPSGVSHTPYGKRPGPARPHRPKKRIDRAAPPTRPELRRCRIPGAMNYELTRHARERVRERKIELAWIERALTRPDRTEPDEVDPDLEHRLAIIPEKGGGVLRVVCRPGADPLRVVTAHFDRGMKGKL